MKARKREREQQADAGTPERGSGGRQRDRGGKGSGSSGGRGSGGKRSNDQRSGRRGRNRSGRQDRRGRSRGQQRRQEGVGFWGDPDKLPDAAADVRITDDPAAVARSLGHPHLPGHEAIAEHYFAAVYDRAVHTAGALAAAGGLIDPESLVDDDA